MLWRKSRPLVETETKLGAHFHIDGNVSLENQLTTAKGISMFRLIFEGLLGDKLTRGIYWVERKRGFNRPLTLVQRLQVEKGYLPMWREEVSYPLIVREAGMKSVEQSVAKPPTKISDSLELISGSETIELNETDGQETIAGAKDVFSYICPEFSERHVNSASPTTGKTRVGVYEMVHRGSFYEMLGCKFGDKEDRLDEFVMTQPQIIQFLRSHSKWLSKRATFFLFKSQYNAIIVVGVFIESKRLLAVEYPLYYDAGWSLEYEWRFVRPIPAIVSIPR